MMGALVSSGLRDLIAPDRRIWLDANGGETS
jgi:hypothetical protein